MFIPSFTPMVEHTLLFRRIEGRTENFTPQGITLLPWDKIHHWGTTSPLGWGQILPLGAKLRMGLTLLMLNFHRKARPRFIDRSAKIFQLPTLSRMYLETK
jgi:hypothetical protein